MSAPAVELTAQATVVLVGGHESDRGEALHALAQDSPLTRARACGQELEEAVRAALITSELPVCVVPMTLGRDPELVADTARTLAWVARTTGPPRIALAEPFGTAEHLIGWLRAAAGRAAVGAAGAAGADPADVAILVTANPANPFDDAELFRIARLVQVQGRAPWVDVAFHGGDPDVQTGVDRCRRLGARRVALVPAGFAPAGGTEVAAAEAAGAVDAGPLLAPSAISGVLAARIQAAVDRLRAGDDGIAAGLDAEHGHGHTHSHTDGPAARGHTHSHASGH
ncbi:hypothetical protein KGQ20_24695 [Catenulispora sp. NF23]|uniref:hypothetical protein n=1 Tax=Catenulispora pinistramenti TaxID=2705254 RepID=UPI001BA48A52|nr:hypothetical protein [Catenulispora pinistramenti]MBS2535966.1 hypothetical protein [Catenulispora pinistramenti]